MSYYTDIEQAAKSSKDFDKVNVLEIADFHGEDPSQVQRDIDAHRCFPSDVGCGKSTAQRIK